MWWYFYWIRQTHEHLVPLSAGDITSTMKAERAWETSKLEETQNSTWLAIQTIISSSCVISPGLFLSSQPSTSVAVESYGAACRAASAESEWNGTPGWLYCILSGTDLLWQHQLPTEPCHQVLGLLLCKTLDTLQPFSKDLVRKSPDAAENHQIFITKYTITHPPTLKGNRPLGFGLKSNSCVFFLNQ